MIRSAAVSAVLGGTLIDPLTGWSGPGDLRLGDGRVLATTLGRDTGRGEPFAPAPASRSDPVSRSGGPREQEGLEGLEGLEGRSIDATGLLVAPGLIDLQVNGAAGIDLTAEPERLWEVAAALPRHGITSFLPTLVTTDPATRERALAALAAGRPAGVPAGARPLGLHFEGPMLSPQRSGAHDRSLLRAPSPQLVAGWSADAGVLMVTMAPELPGGVEVIRALVERGVTVSLGHTAADLATIRGAVAAGARALTHLFNAMPGLDHREPGPVGAALGGTDLVAGVIVDGLHVHPAAVVAAHRALGRDRFLAVSDTTAALDQPDGPAWLGSRRVEIRDGAVRLVDGGGLAGSAVGLDRCLQLLARFTGLPPVEVLAAATAVPAALLRRPELGRWEAGAAADVVLLSPELVPVATVVEGRLLHDRRAAPGPGEEVW